MKKDVNNYKLSKQNQDNDETQNTNITNNNNINNKYDNPPNNNFCIKYAKK